MELLDNNFVKWHVRISELLIRYKKEHPANCTLIIGNDMVKYPDRFIHYCLSNLPLNGLIFDGGVKEWKVIDGNKRLRTIINFIDNQFPLEDGTYFKDLPGYLKFRISDGLTFSSLILTSSTQELKDTLINYIQEQ